MSNKFNIRLTELLIIRRPNSGVASGRNENLDTISGRIDRLLLAINTYWNSSTKIARILSQFQLYSGLGYSDKFLDSNNTGFSDEEVKELLVEYHSKYKEPLRGLLQTWLRVKFNPDLCFHGHLMEHLGIRRCKKCDSDSPVVTEEKLENAVHIDEGLSGYTEE